MTREELLARHGQPFRVLDHGHVRLVDVMGDDAAIVQAARVSYGQGTKAVSEDRSLVRYLMRHKHMSPFEMCEIKLHIKLPIFVARQWIRHRTASVNELSGRYSIITDDYYMPEWRQVCAQAKDNKQGRGEALDEEAASDALVNMANAGEEAFCQYEGLIKMGVARETARIVLPLSTYTEWYWKVDLRNLLGFLKQRLDSHAQYEIRVFAEIIAEIVKDWCPVAWEAFVDYDLEAVTFSREEVRLIRATVQRDPFDDAALRLADVDLSARERAEFLAKLGVV